MEKTEDPSRVDRLSALPLDLICHILSFLPSKLSVSTSALSRRWRYMWAHVPTMDFDSTVAFRGGRLNDFLLLYKVQNLITFSLSTPNLHCYANNNDDRLETWLDIAVARNVRNMNLCLNHSHVVPTIRPLLTCETLVNLSLSRCKARVPSSGTAVNLPSLKKLRLYLVDIGESLPHLLSGCQVLHELIVEDPRNTASNSRCVDISSPTIKRLTVEFSVIKIQDAYEARCVCWKVKINAPALTYLKVDDFRGVGVSVSQVTSFSIEQADVRLRKYASNGDYTPSEVEFLDFLCDAKCLRLAGYIDVSLSNVRFDSLTKLELDLTVDCPSIVKLLESADNLQVLVVDLNLANWEDPKRVPKCVSLHLRTIRTGPIVCGKHEFNMLRYLARNAKVLEMMDLRYANCNKARFEALRRILLCRRERDVCVLAMEREWL